MLPVGHYPIRSMRTKPACPPNAVIAQVSMKEEEESDVNLSVHLLNDAWKDLFDVAVVITNDTDLVTPIRVVAIEREKPVYAICPGRRKIAFQLEQVANRVWHTRPAMLKAAQFPDRIPDTTISKPANW